MFGKRARKEQLYVPLTSRDEATRRDVRYRVGRWIDRRTYNEATALALFVLVGIPLAFVLEGELAPARQLLALTILWLLSLLVLYMFWFFKKQEISENRRGYRFRAPELHDDSDVAGATRVLLELNATESDREQAIELLRTRGALTAYRPDLKQAAVLWAGAILLVCLLVVAVWLL